MKTKKTKPEKRVRCTKMEGIDFDDGSLVSVEVLDNLHLINMTVYAPYEKRFGRKGTLFKISMRGILSFSFSSLYIGNRSSGVDVDAVLLKEDEELDFWQERVDALLRGSLIVGRDFPHNHVYKIIFCSTYFQSPRDDEERDIKVVCRDFKVQPLNEEWDRGRPKLM